MLVGVGVVGLFPAMFNIIFATKTNTHQTGGGIDCRLCSWSYCGSVQPPSPLLGKWFLFIFSFDHGLPCVWFVVWAAYVLSAACVLWAAYVEFLGG